MARWRLIDIAGAKVPINLDWTHEDLKRERDEALRRLAEGEAALAETEAELARRLLASEMERKQTG